SPSRCWPSTSSATVSGIRSIRAFRGACRGQNVTTSATASSVRTAPEPAGDTILSVRELRTQFFTRDGVIRAVDGVSFDLHRGETLCIVGESGCGKSVTALSILGLIPPKAGRIVGGSIRFEGTEL